jgi:hypothetical protein
MSGVSARFIGSEILRPDWRRAGVVIESNHGKPRRRGDGASSWAQAMLSA